MGIDVFMSFYVSGFYYSPPLCILISSRIYPTGHGLVIFQALARSLWREFCFFEEYHLNEQLDA